MYLCMSGSHLQTGIDQDKTLLFVDMTLTSAGCEMGAIICGRRKRQALLQVPMLKGHCNGGMFGV